MDIVEREIIRGGWQTERHSFGVYLRSTRMAHGMSLRELARQAGVSPTWMSLIERGEQVPTYDGTVTIAQILEVSVDAMVCHAGYIPEDVNRLIRARPAVMCPFVRAGGRLPAHRIEAITEEMRELTRRKKSA